MKLVELETLLSPEDIDKNVQLHCLACRRRLASASRAERLAEDGTASVGVAIANLSADLRDFQQSRTVVHLTCGCSTRSIYHVL